jgi:hypothetical protein
VDEESVYEALEEDCYGGVCLRCDVSDIGRLCDGSAELVDY